MSSHAFRIALISVALGLALVLAPRAGTAATVLEFDVTWAGIAAARAALELPGVAEPTRRTRIEIRTLGVPRLLTGFQAVAESHQTKLYDARYALRGRDRRMAFALQPVGGSSVARRDPFDTSKRAELPEVWRRDVLDPLAALTTLRDGLIAGRVKIGDRFSLPVYDGRRRFDVEGRIPAPVDVTWNGRRLPVHRIEIVLRPRAGFSAAELDGEEDPEDVVRNAQVIVSADGRAWPLAFDVPAAGFTFSARLARGCTEDACDGSEATTPRLATGH